MSDGTPLGTCGVHDKLLYIDRKTARAAARRYPGNKKHPYPCSANPGMWHLGGLPDVIRQGHLSRGDIFGRAA